MTKVLLDYTVEQAYLSGIVELAFPADFSLWREAYNIMYFDGALRSLPVFKFVSGYGTVFDDLVGYFDDLVGYFDDLSFSQTGSNLVPLTSTPLGAIYQFQDSDGVIETFTVADGTIHQYLGVNGAAIDTGYTSDYFSFGNFGDWVFGTNGTDTPIVIKDGVVSNPTEYPSTAVSLLVFNGFLIYFGVNTDRRDFQWSGYNEPEGLDVGTYPTAGTFTTQKLRNGHVVAVPLQNYIVLYTGDQHLIVFFSDFPNYFGVRDPLPFGVINKRCVASDGEKHYCLATNGFFVTDGYRASIIGDDRITKYYLRNADFSMLEYFFAYFDVTINAAKFFYRTLNGEQEAIVFYVGKDQVLIERFDACVAARGVNNRSIYGFVNGNLYEQRLDIEAFDSADDTFGVSAKLSSKWFSPGKEYQRTYFDYFALRLPSYSGSVLCTPFAVDERGVEQQGNVKVVGSSFGKIVRVPLQRNALYSYVTIESNPQSSFRISGLQVLGKLEGRIK